MNKAAIIIASLLTYVNPIYSNAVTKLVNQLFKDAETQSSVQDIINDLESGKKELREGHHYFRKLVITNAEPSGTHNLVKTTDDLLTGRSTFSKGYLTDNEIFVVSHVGLGYATTAGGAGAVPESLLFENTIFNPKAYANGTVDANAGEAGNQFFPVEAQLIPNKILNTEVSFKSGKKVWLDGLFIDFTKKHKLNTSPFIGAKDSTQFRELAFPQVLDAKKFNDVEFEFPKDATAAGTADYFFSVDYYGLKIVDVA